MNERDELARIIKTEYIRAIDRKRPQDCWDAPADAIVAAGYRKHRTITTVEELDALPEGAILRANYGGVWTRIIDGLGAVWRCAGYRNHYRADEIELPAMVLHEPEAV